MIDRKRLSIPKFLAAAGLLTAALWQPAAHASVNLWWNHIHPTTMDVAQCVSTADNLLRAAQAGKISKEPDAVRSWSEHLIAVVECLNFDGKTTVMVVVSADKEKVNEGGNLYNTLIEGMKK